MFMNYPYSQRMNDLDEVLAIKDAEIRRQALKCFIAQETELLGSFKPPLVRSRPLDRASMKYSLLIAESNCPTYRR